jgi:O-antigen/teichoic acid export membrane protein
VPTGASAASSDLRLPLKQRVLRASGWSFAGYGMQQALRVASSLVMTRLLVPEMFGVMALVAMVATVLWMLSDIGLGQNIVQSRRGQEPAFLDTAWSVQVVRGFVVWLVSLTLAAALYLANRRGLLPAGSVYAFPALPMIIAVSSFSAVIESFQSMRMASALRAFDQKPLIQIELAGQLAGLVVMVAAAAASGSIWSIVAGLLVTSSTRTALSHTWMTGHANRLRVETRALREVLGFGKWVFVSSAVGILAASGDRLLLGGLIDPHVMGLYAIASLVIGALESGIYRFFATVSLPALSEIARNDPVRLREVYNRLRFPGDLLLLFMAGALFAAGHRVIELLYDPRYAAAGGMLQVLALSLIAVRYGVAQQVYLAVGLTRYLALINAVRMVALYSLVPALYLLAGLQGALWAIALHGLATLPFVYCFNARLGLNDLQRELPVLAALPAGYLCGALLNLVQP